MPTLSLRYRFSVHNLSIPEKGIFPLLNSQPFVKSLPTIETKCTDVAVEIRHIKKKQQQHKEIEKKKRKKRKGHQVGGKSDASAPEFFSLVALLPYINVWVSEWACVDDLFIYLFTCSHAEPTVRKTTATTQKTQVKWIKSKKWKKARNDIIIFILPLVQIQSA